MGIAADIYRITKSRRLLNTIFGPVVRAAKFIEELCAQTNARNGPQTRFHGPLAPSISHEGYSNPSYSYWDDYFALSAWRNCEYLASEVGDHTVAAHANAKGRELAENLTRSIRMTAEQIKTELIPGSADREDVDPSSTAIAFEPCQVEDVLPSELIPATYDRAAARVRAIRSPRLQGKLHAVRTTNPQRVHLPGQIPRRLPTPLDGSYWPKASRLAWMGRGRMGRIANAGVHRRHAAHLDRSRVLHDNSQDAAEGKRQHTGTVSRRPKILVEWRGHCTA